MDKYKISSPQLQHQIKLAAGFLVIPWLSTLFLYRHQLLWQPMMLLGLLPGLAVALRILDVLSRYSGANLCQSEEFHTFTTLGAANWITLLRAGAIVVLAGFLPLAIQQDRASPGALTWAPGAIYLGISLADLVDGYVARNLSRETLLGKRLDIESDAAGLLVASLVGVALGRLPAVYLLVGLAYYLFIFGVWTRQKRALPVTAPPSRPYARIIAGFQMGLVGMALFPVFDRTFTTIAALIFMVPLLIGFIRDWRVVSCRVKTDSHRQSNRDVRQRSLMGETGPLVLRLVILTGGVTTLAGYDVYQADTLCQLAHGTFCLLAVLGCMGRSASLFLVLMIGSDLSPLGMSVMATLTFCSAAMLMLTGTGAMSFWAPEDKILYRRSKDGSWMTPRKYLLKRTVT